MRENNVNVVHLQQLRSEMNDQEHCSSKTQRDCPVMILVARIHYTSVLHVHEDITVSRRFHITQKTFSRASSSPNELFGRRRGMVHSHTSSLISNTAHRYFPGEVCSDVVMSFFVATT